MGMSTIGRSGASDEKERKKSRRKYYLRHEKLMNSFKPNNHIEEIQHKINNYKTVIKNCNYDLNNLFRNNINIIRKKETAEECIAELQNELIQNDK